MSWRTHWKIDEQIRNSIWIVPAIFAIVAIVLGILVPEFDKRTTAEIGISYGSSAAQGILGAISGGMITFTGFVFSILLLAVQFGSSQFSPRMLRRFLRDPTTKLSLGLFMATFIYALLVLRTVEPSNNQNFIPDFSVSISLLMLILSMFVFLRLISRTTQGLRVASVLRELGQDGSKILARTYPEPQSGLERKHEPATVGNFRDVTFLDEPGILQSIDRQGLVEIAARSGAVIELLTSTGTPMYDGVPLFRIYAESTPIEDTELRKSVAVGDERTMKQDPAFLFRLLADISSKALSPGVNDPTTSIQSLDQIELLLHQLSTQRLTPGEGRDENGEVRLRYPTPAWEDFLSIALDETRYFGAGSIQVARRIRALLEGLLDSVPEHRRPAVEIQLQRLEENVQTNFAASAELEMAATGDRQGIGSPA